LKFIKTKFEGVYLIEAKKIKDERGFFATPWEKNTFSENGINSEFVESNISFNHKKGTIRGMHYQINNFQDKLVICTRGRIFDVAVDLRPESSTFKQWTSIELSEENPTMIYIPKRFAHGFQTLEDNSGIFYQMSEYYNPDGSRGFRFDDPNIAISWPIQVSAISKNDQNLRFFEDIGTSDFT